jgi:hypothetical protein
MPDRIRGERGETGDTGKTGADGSTGAHGLTGDTGAHGHIGPQGNRGERGPTGDHGQDGVAGGVGDKGTTGKAGADLRRAMLTMFIAFVLVVAVGGWLIAENTKRINENVTNEQRSNAAIQKAQQHESCVRGAAILIQFNTFLEAMSQVEQQGIDSGDAPELTPTRKARIEAYDRARMDIPDCSPQNKEE